MSQIIIRGNNHFYRDLNSESKEVILLVHGHPFDNSMWNYQLETLKNFRLILPDLKGYGQTDYKFDKIYIEEQALDLAILLDHLEIEKVHLIGLSMGGQIIIEFSRLFPNRVKSLIICDSNPIGETEESYKNRLLLADKIQTIGITEYTEQEIHKYLHKDNLDENNPVYNHLYKMMINTKTGGAVASHKGRAERRSNYNYLKFIALPTLVIVGENDFFTPVSEMKDIAEQIPNAEFEVIEKAGHMPNMEQSEIFNRLISDFYKKYN